MDESTSSSATIRLGSRAIDRYNPIIRDSSRLKKSSQNTTILSSSNEEPGRKSGFGTMQLGRPQRDLDVFTPTLPARVKNSTSLNKHRIFSKSKENNPEIVTGCISFSTKLSNIDDKRKSATATESTNENGDDNSKKNVNNRMIKKKSSWSCTNPGEFFSPPGSSRYLLTSTHQKSSVHIPDFDPLLPPPSPLLLSADSKPKLNDTPSAAPPPARSSQQVSNLLLTLYVSSLVSFIQFFFASLLLPSIIDGDLTNLIMFNFNATMLITYILDSILLISLPGRALLLI